VGNNTESTAIVAAFGHPQIGDSLGSGAITGQIFIGDKSGIGADFFDSFSRLYPFDDLDNFLIISRANNGHGFRQFRQEFILEMLGHTAGDNNFFISLLLE